ncbi:hypothetical protein BCV69DRAFT_300648 [Microstroma glucosiphilum]|uniref:Uncharacterized protein n=1 Tax=Pseudomicrostroma glucosiphilum TaxID=1684307 RepID=A0A316U299_9BASI|nr:hypothetical protein BCV69DRAFT_300648 [Pseudomicrostroma glucosiphilum]PWN19330.1 hypothetical protein BCV69DRAFT_300648 [Pseudomicrostroma glucosiphilum]
MSYIVNVLRSAALDSFENLNRPSVLPALPVLDQLLLLVEPSQRLLGEIGSLAVALYDMEVDQMQTAESEQLSTTDGTHEDGDYSGGSGGSGGASSFGNRGPDGSRSDRHHSSMGESSRFSSSVDTSLDSQMTEGILNAATSSLQLGSKAAADVPLNSDSAESE